ncbi:MAG TPA: hypothetical protein VF867_18710 [Arthrobacter sp.]
MDRDEQLRAWAKGTYPEEAATELLIRAFSGRFTGNGWAWMQTNVDGAPWIDFEAIPDHIGALSGGEQRFLRLVATLSGAAPAVLGDILSGLDRDVVDLVLAAVAHAAGTHDGVEMIHTPDGHATFTRAETLHPWPAAARRLRLVD